jgi:hypothetical protein
MGDLLNITGWVIVGLGLTVLAAEVIKTVKLLRHYK